jgi:hypothetical protein
MADTSDVIIPSGTETWIAFTTGLDIAQVHAERTANGNDAPGSLLGIQSGVPRNDDCLVRGY